MWGSSYIYVTFIVGETQVLSLILLCMWGENSSREHPPGKPPGKLRAIEKNILSNVQPHGQFSLANAPSPVLNMVFKCLAPESIRSLYKDISFRFLINITDCMLGRLYEWVKIFFKMK